MYACSHFYTEILIFPQKSRNLCVADPGSDGARTVVGPQLPYFYKILLKFRKNLNKMLNKKFK